jgi:hypothetical protein
MRLTWKDALVTVLVAAVAVPYVGYLVRGSMPLTESWRHGASVVSLMASSRTARSGPASLLRRDRW